MCPESATRLLAKGVALGQIPRLQFVRNKKPVKPKIVVLKPATEPPPEPEPEMDLDPDEGFADFDEDEQTEDEKLRAWLRKLIENRYSLVVQTSRGNNATRYYGIYDARTQAQWIVSDDKRTVLDEIRILTEQQLEQALAARTPFQAGQAELAA